MFLYAKQFLRSHFAVMFHTGVEDRGIIARIVRVGNDLCFVGMQFFAYFSVLNKVY